MEHKWGDLGYADKKMTAPYFDVRTRARPDGSWRSLGVSFGPNFARDIFGKKRTPRPPGLVGSSRFPFAKWCPASSAFPYPPPTAVPSPLEKKYGHLIHPPCFLSHRVKFFSLLPSSARRITLRNISRRRGGFGLTHRFFFFQKGMISKDVPPRYGSRPFELVPCISLPTRLEVGGEKKRMTEVALGGKEIFPLKRKMGVWNRAEVRVRELKNRAPEG